MPERTFMKPRVAHLLMHWAVKLEPSMVSQAHTPKMGAPMHA